MINIIILQDLIKENISVLLQINIRIRIIPDRKVLLNYINFKLRMLSRRNLLLDCEFRGLL